MKRKADPEKVKKVLERRGYPGGALPRGKEVHHIKPLAEGGKDTSKNLVVIPRRKHQQIHRNRCLRGEE